MQSPDRTSAEIFAEYHGRGNRRGLIVAGVLALCLAVGGSAALVSVIAGAGSGADDPSADALVAADFSTTIKESQELARSGHFELTMTADGTSATAYGDFSSSETDLLMTMTMSLPERGELITMLVGDAAYVNAGEASHNRFIKVDLADATDPLATSVAGLSTAADPGRAVSFPDKAISSVKVAGPAVALDGVRAVPYTVVVDTAAVAAELGYSAEVVATLPAQTQYRYWIGPDHLIRKVSYEVAGGSFEIAFTRWGQTVPIEAPTADQITTVTSGT